jgi:hypothetical protein
MIEDLLDPVTAYLTRRSPREGGLTPAERVAVYLLWNGGKGYKVGLLAKAFRVSRNTIYYKALTGKGDSYPNTSRSNQAEDTQALIDYMGVEAATERFVTPEIRALVQAEVDRQIAWQNSRRRRG